MQAPRWAIRALPNVIFVHFTNLKRDLPGQMRRVAAFLGIPVNEARWDTILEYCSFPWMKKHATQSVPLGGAFWDAGAEVFIDRGVNGRWMDILDPREVAEYEARALTELGPAWCTLARNGRRSGPGVRRSEPVDAWRAWRLPSPEGRCPTCRAP